MLKNMLQEELSRALRSPRWWIAVLLTLLVLAWGYKTILSTGDVAPDGYSFADLWYFVFFYSHFSYLLPLIASLPFAETLAQDREEGFIRYLTFRSNYRQYLGAKFLVNALMTALCIALPLLSLYAFGNFVAPRDIHPINTWQPNIVGRPWGFLLPFFEANPDGFIMLMILLVVVMGVLYSSLGTAVALIYPNRYLTLGVPLGLFLASHFISGKTHLFGTKWSPLTALYTNPMYVGPEPTPISLFLHPAAVLVLLLIIVAVFGRRKLVLQ